MQLLKEFDLPPRQTNERSALALLALANLKPNAKWQEATSQSMSVVGNKEGNGKYPGVMKFINDHYGRFRKYKENSRETFRDETIKPFVNAGILEKNPENPRLSTNSKDNHYRLTTEALRVIRSYKTTDFETELAAFKEVAGSLVELYAKARELAKVPIKLSDGTEFQYTPGKHNELQKAVFENFAPIYAPGAIVVYVGDTADKDSHMDNALLGRLNIPIALDTKLPDIVLYDAERDWLFLIEAVTSVGPMSPQRILELEKLLQNCSSGKIYITAFPDKATFRRFIADIAWETEVWVAEDPTHMIHFNGDRFYGPRN